MNSVDQYNLQGAGCPINLDKKLVFSGWHYIKAYQIELTQCIGYYLDPPTACFFICMYMSEKVFSGSYNFKKANL